MGGVWQAQLGESLIWETLGQRQICQSPGLALNVHSGNDWDPIPVLTGEWPSGRFRPRQHKFMEMNGGRLASPIRGELNLGNFRAKANLPKPRSCPKRPFRQ